MNMIGHIISIGNRVAVRLPEKCLQEIGLEIDSLVNVAVEPETRSIFINPASPSDIVAWLKKHSRLAK